MIKNFTIAKKILIYLIFTTCFLFYVNLVVNAVGNDFDNKISDSECTSNSIWKSDMSVSIDTNIYYSGTTSLKLTTNSIGHYGVILKHPYIGNTFPIENGQKYSYSFWVKVNNADLAGVKLTIPYYYKKAGDVNNTYVPTPNYANNYHSLLKTDDWQYVSATFVADLSSFSNSIGATPVELDFQMSAIKAGGGTISNLSMWFDKVSLRKVPQDNQAITTLTVTNPPIGMQNIPNQTKSIEFLYDTTYIDEASLSNAEVVLNGGKVNKEDYELLLINNSTQNTSVLKIDFNKQSMNLNNKEITIHNIVDLWGRPINAIATYHANIPIVIPTEPKILLDESFSMTYLPPGQNTTHISGWDVSGNGGYVEGRNTYTGFKIVDNSASGTVQMSKILKQQSDGVINFEFRIKPSDITGDTSFILSNDNNAVLKLQFIDGHLYYMLNDTKYLISDYVANLDFAVKAVVDLTNKIASVYCNDIICISNIDLFSEYDIYKIIVETGSEKTGEVFLKAIKINSGYIIKENFIANQPIDFNSDDWQKSGSITTEASDEDLSDPYNLLLTDTTTTSSVSLSREFYRVNSGLLTLEYKFFMNVLADFSLLKIKSDENTVFSLSSTQDGKLYFGDNIINIVSSYKNNLWYDIKIAIDLSNNKAKIYVNHKLKNENISVGNITNGVNSLEFSTSDLGIGNLKLDNISLYKETQYSDYVPEPIPAYSDKLLAILSCNIWREGSHRGWDSINRFDERKPLLGYYDEGNVEVADWEIKWLVEHGIDAQIFCWYNYNTTERPIKTPKYSQGLDAYMNAKYSNLMDFSILWANSTTTSGIFRNSIVPYWIEYYFKDDRYLKIDNKPVVYVLSSGGLVSSFGSYANLKAEIDYLNEECKKIGFSGVTVCAYPSLSLISNETKIALEGAGVNSFFTYGYGSYYNIDDIKKRYQNNPYYIPVLSVTQNTEAWTGIYGRYTSPNEFDSLAKWFRDVLLPNRNYGNIGDNMLIIDNWNEYGEGHYIMPTNKLGFSNLDVVRNTFTNANTAHTDVIPTETQKDRFNNLYNKDRIYSEEPILKKDLSQVYELKKWTFNSRTAWTSSGYTASDILLESYTGVLKGKITNVDPIIIKSNLNIDISKSKIVKIRIKSKGSFGQIHFGVVGKTGFDASRSADFYANPNSTTITEYEVDMRQNKEWNGILTDIRLDVPGNINDEFELESITIMSDDVITTNNIIEMNFGFENSDAIPVGFNFSNCNTNVQHKEFYYGASALEILKAQNNSIIEYKLPDLKNAPQNYYYSFFAKQPYNVSNSGSINIYAKYIQNDVLYTKQISSISLLSNNYWDEIKGSFILGTFGNITDVKLYIESSFAIYYIDDFKILPINVAYTSNIINGSKKVPTDDSILFTIGTALNSSSILSSNILINGSRENVIIENVTSNGFLIVLENPLKTNTDYEILIDGLKTSTGSFLPPLNLSFSTGNGIIVSQKKYYKNYNTALQYEMNENEISGLVTAVIEIYNPNFTGILGNHIISVYSGGKLVDIKVDNFSVEPLASNIIEKEINVSSGNTIKEFFWNSLSDITPY